MAELSSEWLKFKAELAAGSGCDVEASKLLKAAHEIDGLRDQLAGAFRHLRELQNAVRGTDDNTSTGHAQRKAIEEAKRLRAVVDRLPKTADGVTVVPGQDKAWAFRAGEWRQGWVVVQGANDSGAVEIVIETDDGPAYGMPEVSDCYSTREAAEKARGDERNITGTTSTKET